MEPDRDGPIAGVCIVLHNLEMVWQVSLVEKGNADDKHNKHPFTFGWNLPLSTVSYFGQAAI